MTQNFFTTPATSTSTFFPPPALQAYYTARHQRVVDAWKKGIGSNDPEQTTNRLAGLGGVAPNPSGGGVVGTGAININTFRAGLQAGKSESDALASAIVDPSGMTTDGVPLQQRVAEQFALEQAAAQAIHGHSTTTESLIAIRMMNFPLLEGAKKRAAAVVMVARGDLGLSKDVAAKLAAPRLAIPISQIHAIRPGGHASPVPPGGFSDPGYYADANPYAGLGPPPYAGLGPPPFPATVAGMSIIGASPWKRLYPWI